MVTYVHFDQTIVNEWMEIVLSIIFPSLTRQADANSRHELFRGVETAFIVTMFDSMMSSF